MVCCYCLYYLVHESCERGKVEEKLLGTVDKISFTTLDVAVVSHLAFYFQSVLEFFLLSLHRNNHAIALDAILKSVVLICQPGTKPKTTPYFCRHWVDNIKNNFLYFYDVINSTLPCLHLTGKKSW